MRYLGLVFGTLLTLAGASALAVALTRSVSVGSAGDGGDLALLFLGSFGAIVVGVMALAVAAQRLAAARSAVPEDTTIARFTSNSPDLTRMTPSSTTISPLVTIDASGGHLGHAAHAGHAGHDARAAIAVELPAFVGQFLRTFDPQAFAGMTRLTSGSVTIAPPVTFDLRQGADGQAASLGADAVDAVARLETLQDTGVAIGDRRLFTVELTVSPAGGEPYRVPHAALVPASAASRLSVGSELPARVSARDANQVIVDWEAMPA